VSKAGELCDIVRQRAVMSDDRLLAEAAMALADIYESSWRLTADLVDSLDRINEKAKGAGL
jgi:hypothetical protein